MAVAVETQANTIAKPEKKTVKFDPKKKLRDAVKNAKQRCTNPNNPDFQNYGAKGIKCLVTAKDVEQDIGLPKNKDVSLDRIDPAGHYQIGNLRWTNKHVQAANKKKLVGDYVLDAQIAQSKQAADTTAYRRELVRTWEIAVRAHNARYLAAKDQQFLDQNIFSGHMLARGYEWDSNKDCAQSERTFCLPSLTCSGQRIKILGGPWGSGWSSGGKEAAESGVIFGLGLLDPKLNAAPQEIEAWAKVRNEGAVEGVIWTGNTTVASLTHYPIEGRMLAMASRLFRYHGKSGALFPALTVFDLMDEAWPNWMSELDCHPLLNANALFIPDLQVSEGSGWFPDHNQCSQMLNLLRYRARYGLKTLLGVQDLSKLSLGLRTYLLTPGRFERLHAGSYACPEHPEPESFPPYPKPKFYGQYE